jgi:TolA-binding protein
MPTARSQEAAEPGEEPTDQLIPQPPLFNLWFAQTRWDDAYALERSAGYDNLKIGEAIEGYRMFLNLFPTAGMANEAAWRICNLKTRYRELPKTIEAYEEYIEGFPDGDYAADALWSLIYQYMRVPDWDKVYENYDQFLQQFARSPYGDEALNGLAGRAQSMGNYELAFNWYQQLLERYPTSDYCDDAVSAMGAIYAKEMNVEAATQAYFRLANEYPYSSLVEPGIQQLVYLYYRTNDVMKALELGEAFLEAFPHSRYARYVRMYMYYAVQRARLTVPGLDLAAPGYGDDEEVDEYKLLQEQHDEMYTAAGSAAKTANYAEAVRLYQEFMAAFPNSDRTDDALYAIGSAFDSLETYADSREDARTPEQLSQVEEDWRRVASGFEAALDAPGGKPVNSAIEAYIVLARSMPGSDLRDDALYKVAADYEKLEDWVSAVKAYLDLITIFPVSSWANTAVSRLDSLQTKLPDRRDRATVLNTIIDTYPHHSLSDDFVHRLAVQALLDGNVQAARDLFARYVTDYPHRSKASEALFWQARCEQLLGAPHTARVLYGQVAVNFQQSGLADDAYFEHELIRLGQNEKVLEAEQAALNRAAEAVGEPLLGYEAIARNHILLLVPSDKAMDVRAYNLADRLEQGYLTLADVWGRRPQNGQRVEILVDPKVNAFTPGSPARVPQSMVGPPPVWRHWFEAVASAFVNDPQIAGVTKAIPGLGDGAARFASVQLDDYLYADIGEMNIGASAVQSHLSDLNTAKREASQALSKHTQAKATADKIDATIGLGIWWHISDRLAAVPGEIIDWTPVVPIFGAVSVIPAEVSAKAETLEQKAALVAYWFNSGAGSDQSSMLRSWGIPVTAEEMAKVKAAVEEPQQEAPEGTETQPKPAETEGEGDQKETPAESG